MKKVLMLATTAAMIEQFNKNNIELLIQMGYQVDVAGNFCEGNPISNERLEQFKKWITERGGKYYDIPSVRKPTDLKMNVRAYRQVVQILNSNQYEFVHVHTPIGSIIGRLATHKVGVPIIYTAHGFHFFKGAPIKNWLLYYPAEWLCSWWTDVLITINQEDYRFAKKHMHARAVKYIPGIGIDVKKIAEIKCSEEGTRKRLALKTDDILLLSVGELNENKNHEVVIRAISKLHNENIHYVICGKGELQEWLVRLADELGVRKQVHIMGFCDNVMEWYCAGDIFVFPSKREGLSVSLMEAMASGLPIICSRIRGNVDLVVQNQNGFLVQNEEIDCYSSHIKMLVEDVELRKQMGEYSKRKVLDFSKENVEKLMEIIYEEGIR